MTLKKMKPWKKVSRANRLYPIFHLRRIRMKTKLTFVLSLISFFSLVWLVTLDLLPLDVSRFVVGLLFMTLAVLAGAYEPQRKRSALTQITRELDK
jgi:hypothetical protein